MTLNPADVNGRLILFLFPPAETLNHTQTHANAKWQSQFHTLLHTSAPTPVLLWWQQVTQSQSCRRHSYKEKENITKRSIRLSCFRPSSPGKAPALPHMSQSIKITAWLQTSSKQQQPAGVTFISSGLFAVI